MKKLLVLLLIQICTCQVFGQKAHLKEGYITKDQMVDLPNQKFDCASNVKRNGPNRTVANSVYYTIPGALFAGWNTEGEGYKYSMAVVPPFVDVTFANQMTDKSRYMWENGAEEKSDVTESAEENGDYISNYTPGGMYFPLILISPRANATYQFNEENYWVRVEAGSTAKDLSMVVATNEIGGSRLMLTATDLHGSRLSSNTYARNTLSGWGFLSTDFLFGSGSVNGSPAWGFEQTYNPLLAPLALDDVRLKALTYNAYGPIPDGKSLKAYILTIDTLTDETTLVATLEALSCDTIDFKDASPKWGNSDENAYKTAYFGDLIYHNIEKATDANGKETPLPIAVPAGKVWRIQFDGMNDEGVSLGVYGVINGEVESTYIKPGYIQTEDGQNLSFQSSISPYISLNGQYEMINVVTKDFLDAEKNESFPSMSFKGWNILCVSNDGKEISNEGLEGTDYNMKGAFVGTSQPWYDENGNANYKIDMDKLPSWIESIQVDVSEYEKDNMTGYNIIRPVCKPLPSGITGRMAEIEITGKAGIPGNNKIVITQGNPVSNPYVVLSEDQTTLTFYGNKAISEINGTIYNFNYVDGKPKWYDKRATIKKVVFDTSYKEIRPTTTASWFYGMSNLSSIEGIENLNTSDVTGMSYMFYGCSSLKSVDLTHFDTSNVTLMGYMFLNCSSLENLDVSSFDTSANTSFYRIFEGCESLTSLDLSTFFIKEGASTSNMLYGCAGLKNLRVSPTMSEIKDNACTNVGSESDPCTIYAPEGFGFGVNTSSSCFKWKNGYFKVPFKIEMTAEAISIYNCSSAKLPVSITNGEYVLDGYQFDIVLPEGISIAKDQYDNYKYTLSNRYSGKMSVAISQRSNKNYRILAYSFNGAVIKGEEGVVITFDLEANNNIVPGNYEGKLTEINLSRADGFGLYPDDVTFGIIVKSARPGDVNHDGKVNVSDVMAVVNFILGSTPSVFFEEEADLNNDTKINVTDVMNIVNIILNEPSGAPLHYRLNNADNIYLRSDGRAYDICLHATEPYTACEMTVQLPDGCELLYATLANSIGYSHKLLTNRMDEGTYRFVVYAPQGEQLHLSNDALVRLSISGNVNSAVKISDILFTNGTFENIILENMEYMPTGIEEITSVPSEAPTYNIQGMKTRSTKKGVYIQNGRKIVVK